MNELQQMLNASSHYNDLRHEAEEAYLANQALLKSAPKKGFIDQCQDYLKSFYSFYTNVAGLGTKMN